MTLERTRQIGIRQVNENERAILEFLALADGEGLTLAHDIASEVGVTPRSMGARLYALETCGFVKRGLVRKPGRYGRRFHGWVITEAGSEVLR